MGDCPKVEAFASRQRRGREGWSPSQTAQAASGTILRLRASAPPASGRTRVDEIRIT